MEKLLQEHRDRLLEKRYGWIGAIIASIILIAIVYLTK
jgi:hypothetical protein